MAISPYMTFSGPRMQTNAAWQSPSLTFKAGVPLTPVDISSWTLSGVAVGASGMRVALSAANGKLLLASATSLIIALSAGDMGLLGVGTVVIEIMRRAPDPVRPLIRLTGQNVQGVA